jgi:hypothetical protein
MLDATGLGHWVGEVELLAHEEQQRLLGYRRIYAEIYLVLHTKKGTKGKITAYFEKFDYPRC